MTIANAIITRRITTILFTNKSLHLAAMMAIFTVTPVIAVRLTGNYSFAGIPGTALLLGRAAGAYPIGWLMDRHGRRQGLSAGFLTAIVGTIIGAFAVMQSFFWLLVIGSLVIGISTSALEQTRYIAAEVAPPENRAKAIGLIVFAGTVGSLGGRLVMEISIRFAEMTGIEELLSPWLVAIALMGIGLILNQLLLRPDPLILGQQVNLAETSHAQLHVLSGRPMSQIFRTPNVLLATTVMALAQLSMTVVMVVTPLHMEDYGYGTLYMSTALMIHTLGMFAFSSITSRLVNRLGAVPTILFGALIFVGSAILGYSAHTLSTIYIAIFLLGLGWNLCHIAGSTMLSDELVSDERGRAQGISEVVVGVTAGIGSLASGTIYGGFGYAGANVVAFASISILLLTLSSLSWAKPRTATTRP